MVPDDPKRHSTRNTQSHTLQKLLLMLYCTKIIWTIFENDNLIQVIFSGDSYCMLIRLHVVQLTEGFVVMCVYMKCTWQLSHSYSWSFINIT